MVTIYQFMLCKIPEEHGSHLHRGRSLKSCKYVLTVTYKPHSSHWLIITHSKVSINRWVSCAWKQKQNQKSVSVGDTLPHTVVGVCGEFQRTGRFLQRGIWLQCVVPRSVVPSVRSSLYQLPDRTKQVLNGAEGRVEVVASLSQGRTAAAQCGLFTYKSIPVIFEPPSYIYVRFCFMNKNSLIPSIMMFHRSDWGRLPAATVSSPEKTSSLASHWR